MVSKADISAGNIVARFTRSTQAICLHKTEIPAHSARRTRRLRPKLAAMVAEAPLSRRGPTINDDVERFMTLSRLRPKLLLALASLAPFAAATPAAADFFFRPFGYAFHQPIPEPAPNASPRAIAGILEEEGFHLVGALGRRGDQVVATGVDRRGRYRRFLIDPYEGEILRSWRVGPEIVHEAPGYVDAPPGAYRGAPPIEPYDGQRTGAVEDPLVVPGLGAEPRRPAPQSAPTARRAETPGRTHAAARPDGAETPRIPHAPPSQATKPPARPTPTQSAAPHSAEKPASPKPAAARPGERKVPAQQQSGPAPATGASPTPPAEPKAPTPPQETTPHAAAPAPESSAAIGHQQAAPAPQAASAPQTTAAPQTAAPAAASPAPSPPANPVSAEQTKAPPTGEPPTSKPTTTPGG